MTILPRLRPCSGLLRNVPTEARLFKVSPDTQILGHCHWQPDRTRRRTLLLVHGFEGCSDSHYMQAIAGKGWRAGLNVIRMNQRNCGGTEHLTPILYHSGLSGDVAALVSELADKDGLRDIWAAGYSMGGNLVLKMAGEAGAAFGPLNGVLAVCPNIDPAACVEALERPSNWFYHRHFLTGIKTRLRRKAPHFPGRFDLAPLNGIQTLRAFDDLYTARQGGFGSAENYYERVGARHVIGAIEAPTVILAAQDDPFIPFPIFDTPAIRSNPRVRLVAPAHGGHCGFYQRSCSGEDGFWAENRILEWVLSGGN
jgi:predicted alpha/beta-fold hydrolase